MYWIKRIFTHIREIMMWNKVIWNDVDWDYISIYDILIFKFTKMIKYYESDKPLQCEESKNEIINDLKKALELTKRLRADKYLEECCEAFNKKYPNFNKEFLNFEPYEDNPKLSKLSPLASQESQDEFTKCCKESDEMRISDKRELFDLLNDKIERWWD